MSFFDFILSYVFVHGKRLKRALLLPKRTMVSTCPVTPIKLYYLLSFSVTTVCFGVMMIRVHGNYIFA